MFGVFCPTREFFTHMETSPLPGRAAKFDLCSALMAIEQRRFFNVPHLLRHGHTVYKGSWRYHDYILLNARRKLLKHFLKTHLTWKSSSNIHIRGCAINENFKSRNRLQIRCQIKKSKHFKILLYCCPYKLLMLLGIKPIHFDFQN